MNELHFSCLDCKEYIDAAYKWGLSHLVNSGPLECHSMINVDDILHTQPFWDVPDTAQHKWIRDLLPHIRVFLDKHTGHKISYCDRTEIENNEEYQGLDWIDCSPDPMISPRHLVEIMGIIEWREVERLVEKEQIKLWWWLDKSLSTPHPDWLDYCNLAKKVFQIYAAKRTG